MDDPLQSALLGDAISAEAFFAEYWETKPLHIARGDRDFFARATPASPAAPLFSRQALLELLKRKPLEQQGSMRVVRTSPDGTARVPAPPPVGGGAHR